MSRISDVLISHSLKSLVYDVYERYEYAEIDMRRDLLTHLTRCAHGVWFLDIAAVVVGFDIAYDDLETTVWVVSWTCVWHDARPYGVIHPLISWFTHNMSLLTLFSCSAAHFVLMLTLFTNLPTSLLTSLLATLSYAVLRLRFQIFTSTQTSQDISINPIHILI